LKRDEGEAINRFALSSALLIRFTTKSIAAHEDIDKLPRKDRNQSHKRLR
jgi:hypothetical protein